MSKTKVVLILLMVMAVFISACGGAATPTRQPTADATEAVSEAATDEATEEATEAVEETEEAATEEATEVMEETEEAATEEATEEAATEEATEAVMEMTEEATEGVEVAMAADAMATASAVAGMAETAADDAMSTATAMAAEVNAAADDAMATASAVVAEATEMMEAMEVTEEATEVAMEMTEEATEEAMEVTEEATEMVMEVTEEATVEATIEPTAVPTEEATEVATEEASGDLIPVSLQLQWVAQSQFAGYYAAVAQGFYEAEGLDVTILEGAVDIVPQTVVASGGAEFGIAWVPKVLASRQEGADLVNIAQIFQRSGTLEVSFADKGIESVEDLRGLKVGTWGFGNEHELYAALRGAGIDPNNPDDVTIVQQPFDMSLLLSGEVDAAEAMTYNEYAQVLEQINPETGELYQPEELNVIDFNEVGTAMLQDHIFTSEAWLAGETDGVSNEEIAVKFIKASIQGWIYARDNFEETVEIVLSNGPTLGQGHMTWQLNEINKLIWPSPEGIGILDAALWEQTVQIAIDGEVIAEEPSEGAFRTDLAQQAVDELTEAGVDVTGADWEAETVEITPGGE